MNPHLPQLRCPGTLGRRAFLRSSLVGLWSLSLADLLRLEAAAADGRWGDRGMGRRSDPDRSRHPPVAPSPHRSILVVWLWGGPSHMETFDLKPEAPAEYRG